MSRLVAASALTVALLAPLASAPTSAASQAATPSALRPGCSPMIRLSSWSTHRLAAQLVVVPVAAGDAGKVAPLARTGFGGILLFGSSAPSSLGETLRRLESSTPQGLGLLVMTDEEGGGVRRLDNLVGAFPWAREMARTMTSRQITSVARRVGGQLLAAGVNVDLAPVLDVDGRDVAPGRLDPDGWRSFGANPSTVIDDGLAFAQGLAEARVLPVVKHFPGLGGSSGNTDYGPAATLPWSVLKASALHTFESAINRHVPAVMVANARVPGLTPLPATLSAKVMRGALRQWLGFKGLILTDSLTAGAISAMNLSVPDAAVHSLQAGSDMVLLGEQATAAADAALAVAVGNAIAAAISRGSFSRTDAERAVSHVLVAKGQTPCVSATSTTALVPPLPRR